MSPDDAGARESRERPTVDAAADEGGDDARNRPDVPHATLVEPLRPRGKPESFGAEGDENGNGELSPPGRKPA